MVTRQPFKITEMYAFVCEDSDAPGVEGIPAVAGPDGIAMPMVCADVARVQSLRPIAQRIAKEYGKRIRLVRFRQMEEVEVFTW